MDRTVGRGSPGHGTPSKGRLTPEPTDDEWTSAERDCPSVLPPVSSRFLWDGWWPTQTVLAWVCPLGSGSKSWQLEIAVQRELRRALRVEEVGATPLTDNRTPANSQTFSYDTLDRL